MDSRIEQQADELRGKVMRHVRQHYPGAVNARAYLHPKYAAEFLGYRYEERPNLNDELRVVGGTASRTSSVIVGLCDRRQRVIQVSEEQPPPERRFTGLHEIGHVVLHPNMDVVHRDRPTKPGEFRPVVERHADEFAAAYGMPASWLLRDVAGRFGAKSIKIEELAWWLDPKQPDQFLRVGGDSLEAQLRMAECTHTPVGLVVALKDAYYVTAMAMAIRLKELGVIDRTSVLHRSV